MMPCAIDILPGRCCKPVIRGAVRGTALFRDCDDYPCGSCGEDVMFVSGPGIEQCVLCARVAEALCDFPMGGGTTCDLPLCETHRIAQGGETLDLDFCPAHALIARGMVTP